MKKLIIKLTICLSVVLALPSCDDDYRTIDILQVEATAPFDLNDRTDWKLELNGVAYNATIADKSMVGVPVNELSVFKMTDQHTFSTFHFPNGYDKPEIINSHCPITLYHPDYKTNLKANENSLFDIEDQSTYDKFFSADVLVGFYVGDFVSTLTGIELVHEKNLLEFTLEGFPENATLEYLSPNQELIKPYVLENQVHKAILEHIEAHFRVKVGNETYKASLGEFTKFATTYHAINDLHLKFTIKYNAEETDASKKITIGNIKASKWSTGEAVPNL